MYVFSRHRNSFLHTVYPFLLSFFFVLHNWQLYFPIVSASEAIKSCSILLTINGIFFFVSRGFLKYSWKAAVTTFFVSFLLLFLNPILSLLKLWGIASDPGKQMLLASIISVVFVLVVRKIKTPVYSFGLFLSITLSVLLCLEIFFLFSRVKHRQHAINYEIEPMNKVTGNKLPSVYVIVFDEYAGLESLKRNLKYDNSTHMKLLEERQFKVVKGAVSNYQHTVLSVPSIFNWNYITTLSGETPQGENAFRQGLVDMYYNSTYTLFRKSGYKTLNYSPFEIDHNPAAYKSFFLPKGTMLILRSTLIGSLSGTLPAKLLALFGEKESIESYYAKKTQDQKRLIENMLNTSKLYKSQPVFCYMHLMLPHGPYLHDSSGNINTEYLSNVSPSVFEQQNAYIQSLSYANKLMINLVDRLKRQTKGESVIIIMSDHGYRSQSFNTGLWYKFNCLNAIYWPGGSAFNWYDGMSNVNQFRILVSSITKRHIPLLKDSLIIK